MNRVSVNLIPVLVLENPFTGVKRILCGMKQTEVNDGFAVVAAFVKQRRHAWKRRFLAVLAPVAAVFNRDFLEAVVRMRTAKTCSSMLCLR